MTQPGDAKTASSLPGPLRESHVAKRGIPIPVAPTAPPASDDELLARQLERLLNRRALSEADAIRAASCLAKGESKESVAASFGVSTATVYAALRRYKIPPPTALDPKLRASKIRSSCAARPAPPPRLNKQRAREAAALVIRNKSIAKTARDLGLKYETLRQALMRHGLKPTLPRAKRGHPSYKLSKDQACAAARVIAQGQSILATAAGLDISPETLRAALRRHGLKPAARQKA